MTFNNFFDPQPEKVEFRETKKSNKNGERFRIFEKERGKNAKNIYQKARPTLRIGGRLLTNEKLETMSKIYEH